jgi:putative thioredoxin
MSDSFDVSLAEFGRGVVMVSRQRPVMVECWASWSRPCRQLRPVVEHLTNLLQGQLLLARVDIEREPELAQQLEVDTVPDLRLFVGGREVDRLLGFHSNRQVLAWLRPHMPSPADEAIAATEAALKARSRTTAHVRAAEAVRADNQNPRAFEVQIRAALLNHDHITARAALSQLKDFDGCEELIAQLEPLVEMSSERFAFANVDPDSLSGRYAQALAAIGKTAWADALAHLMAIVDEEPDWQEGKARQRLRDLFAMLGEHDPLVHDYQARLNRLGY